jgi:hypothetical protein
MQPLKNILLIPGLLGLMLACLNKSGASDATTPLLPKVTVLSTRPLSDTPEKKSSLTVEYGPGGADPIHPHNAHVFVDELEGSVVMGVKGGTTVA